MDKADIIIAEDDPILRDLYLRKFNKKRFEIRTAGNGQEALRMVQERAPQVLLLDINMPVMDGVEFLRQMPREKRNFRVIILTNHEEQLMRDQMKDMGVDGYFVKKDMTLDSLLEMTEGLLVQPVVTQ